jgi:RNA polymerase sigma-32 factor
MITNVPSAGTKRTSLLVERARRAPKLTMEQERDLLQRWQETRDTKVGNRLVECNLRVVVALAVQYRHYQVGVDLLVAEGSMGLVRAMDRFDLTRTTRFSTYAAYWIRYYMMEYIIRAWSVVGGGSGALKSRVFFRLRRERAKVYNQMGEGNEADASLASAMNVTVPQLTKLKSRLEHRDLSLELSSSGGDSRRTILDTLGVSASQHDELDSAQTIARVQPVLKLALEKLNGRERAIVLDRLMGCEDTVPSLSELGARFGVSRERVRQLEGAVKRKLRAIMIETGAVDATA